jgi:two-component system nitrogen regulation sensor histidine kinase GlnL
VSGRFAGLELLATAVLVLDERLRVQYANPAAEGLLAIAARNLHGQDIASLFSERAEVERLLRDAREARWDYAAQSVNYERAGAEPLPLACVVARTDAPESPLVVELRPIGEQLRVERAERLIERHAASRELIRNLAHEIRNPLGGLRGSAQLLALELERPELREYTQVIIAEADRLQALMDRLLTPQRAPQPTRLNIHEVLERVRSLVLAEFAEQVTVICNYDPSVPDLVGDREQLIQALLNVVRNAAQSIALPGGHPPRRGSIILRTRAARQVTIGRQLHKLALELQVIDDGPGVPEEIRERIFSPLVSGREGGSGLGLSLAQAYVQYHGGVIECDSRPGRTVFRILLPLT